MNTYRHKMLLSAAAIALSCSVVQAQDTDTDGSEAVPQNDLLNATLWMANSVEYDATVEGIFALAKLRLDEALEDKDWTAVPDKQGDGYQEEPVAIIADLDEALKAV